MSSLDYTAEDLAELRKVIYGYFGPAYKINTYKTPDQQDRELAEAILAAGYRKSTSSLMAEAWEAGKDAGLNGGWDNPYEPADPS